MRVQLTTESGQTPQHKAGSDPVWRTGVLEGSDPLIRGLTRSLLFCVAVVALPLSTHAAQTTRKPTVLHGLGEVLDGALLELPRTTFELTVQEPPVVGTLVGVLAGAVRAAQKVVGGIVEMAQGFDPWGAKQIERDRKVSSVYGDSTS